MTKVRLYHGTSKKALASIMKEGLRPRCCSQTEAKFRTATKDEYIPDEIRRQLDGDCELMRGVQPIYATTSKENAYSYARFIARGTPAGDRNVGLKGQGEACSYFMHYVETAYNECKSKTTSDCMRYKDWHIYAKQNLKETCEISQMDASMPVVISFDVDIDDENLDERTKYWVKRALTDEKIAKGHGCRIENNILLCDERLDDMIGNRYYGIVMPDQIKGGEDLFEDYYWEYPRGGI